MSKVVHMTYTSSLSSLCEVNSSFDTGVLRIAYTGKNRNGSYISKETFERCIETMYNCPIVCNYNRDDDSIGGHDMEVVSDNNGNLKLVNSTIPVGVIPESSNYFWDSVTEDNGDVHEYLCTDVLIWKRQEAYGKIKNDGITSHSMEISVKDGEVVDGVFVIKDFEFTAFCLLGEDCEPCFESSALGMFSFKDIKNSMNEMMEDLKSDYSLIKRSNAVDNKHPQNKNTEGGNVLDEKIALAAEYGFEIDNLEFSVDELTVDELREKFESMKNVPETHEEVFELNSQICEEIRNVVEAAEMVERPWGEMPRYAVVDYDAEAKMVYCFDSVDNWKLFGFSFNMNGDNVVIDFESKKRMKFAIIEFDNGEQDLPFADVFASIEKKFSANDTQWSEKYQSASDMIASQNDELGVLRQFKADTENAVAKAAREEIFAQFDDELAGIEEFEALRQNCEDIEPEVVREKCFAIRGRVVAVTKFSKDEKPIKLPVLHREPEDDAYGGLFSKYRPKV